METKGKRGRLRKNVTVSQHLGVSLSIQEEQLVREQAKARSVSLFRSYKALVCAGIIKAGKPIHESNSEPVPEEKVPVSTDEAARSTSEVPSDVSALRDNLRAVESQLSEAYAAIKGSAHVAFVRMLDLPICGWWDRGNVVDHLKYQSEKLDYLRSIRDGLADTEGVSFLDDEITDIDKGNKWLRKVLREYPECAVFFFTEEGGFEPLGS